VEFRYRNPGVMGGEFDAEMGMNSVGSVDAVVVDDSGCCWCDGG
jgi:hypothetical protein